MNISIEEKKAEAIARMKMMGIFQETIRQFAEEDLVSISEPPLGAFFWAGDEDLERIRQCEEEYGVLVYMVVRSYTIFGKMDSFLFISNHPEEWPMERNDLADHTRWEHVAYVYNHDLPDFSEMGFVGLAPTIGAGLRRTW